jgi:hypothetical protein
MVLRHSYKVEVARLDAKISGLRFDLFKTQDPKIQAKIEELEKQKEWFEQRIKDGKDTGCYSL